MLPRSPFDTEHELDYLGYVADETKQVSEKAHKPPVLNKADFYMQSIHFWLGYDKFSLRLVIVLES